MSHGPKKVRSGRRRTGHNRKLSDEEISPFYKQDSMDRFLKDPEEKEAIASQLKRKLNPARFPGMSPKMAAIVGYLLGEKFTEPSIVGISITSDGFVLANRSGDIGANEMLGNDTDLTRNLDNLIQAAGLNPTEREEFRAKIRSKINANDWRQVSEAGESAITISPPSFLSPGASNASIPVPKDTNWLEDINKVQFGSSSELTPQFESFDAKFKHQFKKLLGGLGAKDVKMNRGHFYESGFFTMPNGQKWYFNLGDVRMKGLPPVFIRKVKDYQDYTGGQNQQLDASSLPAFVNSMKGILDK